MPVHSMPNASAPAQVTVMTAGGQVAKAKDPLVGPTVFAKPPITVAGDAAQPEPVTR